jgi:hypothetical protein
MLDYKCLRAGAQSCIRCFPSQNALALGDAAKIMGALRTPSSTLRKHTCLMPAAVHDLVDGVRCQLWPVESVALGDLHNHLGVVVQVVGLLPQAEHLPHQDTCTTPRGPAEKKEREPMLEDAGFVE